MMTDYTSSLREGWVKLMRKLADTLTYDNPCACAAYTHCLLRANSQPSTVKGVLLKRGQFITSVSQFAAECGMTEKQMRNALDLMIRDKLIVKQQVPGRANHGTVITVVNYGFTDNVVSEPGQTEGLTEGQTPGQQYKNKNKKKNKKENENDGGGGNRAKYSDAFTAAAIESKFFPIPEYMEDLIQRFGEEITMKAMKHADQYSSPTNDKRSRGYLTKACEGIAAGRDDRQNGDDAIVIRDESIEDW